LPSRRFAIAPICHRADLCVQPHRPDRPLRLIWCLCSQTIGSTPVPKLHGNYQEDEMDKNQVKGEFKKAKGKIKEATGKVTGDKTLEVEGKVEQAAGKVQVQYGKVKSDLKKHR
jgi:uncharacterized protein YjbJ (UPF0337 family)